MGLLSSIGSVAKIASSVAGIAGGLKKPKGPGDQLKSTVKAGQKVGLHPLASIGFQGGYSEPASLLGDIARGGSNIAGELQNIDQRREEKATNKREQARQERLDALTAARTEAEIAEARSRYLLNLANFKRALGEAVPGTANGSVGGLEQMEGPPSPRPTQRDPHKDVPLWNKSVQPDGSTVYIPNEEAFSVGLDEMLGSGSMVGAQAAVNFLERIFSEETFRKAYERSNRRGTPFTDRMMRRNFETLQKIRKGQTP